MRLSKRGLTAIVLLRPPRRDLPTWRSESRRNGGRRPRREPRDVHHGVVVESRIGDPPALDSVNTRVLVVLVVAALAARRSEAGGVEEQGELGVRDLVALDPEVADVDAMLGRLVRWPVV